MKDKKMKTLVLFRLVGSDSFHVAQEGETMSWGNAEAKSVQLEAWLVDAIYASVR